MTPKERWLAAIRMQPVDRLPFWPKLGAAYSKSQAGRFQGMDISSIHDWIGSDKHQGINGCCKEVRQRTTCEIEESGDTMRTHYRTPHGEAELISKFDPASQSWHPVKFPVESLADIQVMTEFFEDVTIVPNEGGLEKARAQARTIGEDALTVNNIGTSPLMHWLEWLAGMETGHYFLADHRPEVEVLFDAMHRILVRKTELLCEYSPADAFYLMENTSTTLISPEQYQRYCAQHIGEYAEIARETDRNLILHMCGHLKALLPQLAGIPARAFEAFTSPTLGDTTLLDGRLECPDKCLIGGTNAILWTRPANEIIRQIEIDLSELPHHRGIVVTSAGVMPPSCEPETIKQVCEWVKYYPARIS